MRSVETRIALIAALSAITGWLLVYSQTIAFTWDEGFHLLAAQLIDAGKRPYLDFCFPQTPLNAWFTALCLRVIGHSWRTAHAAEALLTAGAVALAAGYVARRFEPRAAAGIVAALLFGLNAAVVEFGTLGQAYGLCLFLLVASFRLAVSAAQRDERWRAALAGACAGGAACSSLLTAAALPVLFVWIGRRRRAAFLAGAVPAFLPVAWLFLLDPARTWFNIAGFQLFYRRATWQGPADNDLGVLTAWLTSPQALLLGGLALAGFAWRRKSDIALCGWLALGIGAELCLGHPTFTRYFLLVVPFLAIAAAAGFAELCRRLDWSPSGFRPAAAVSVLVLLGLGRALHDRGDVYRWSDLEAAARRVDQIAPAGSAFWTHEHIYFLARRMPPEGLEFSYAASVNLPDDLAARYHIARERDLGRRARAGEFAAVALCEEDELLDQLGIPPLFRHAEENEGWQFFWDPAGVHAIERTTPPSTRRAAPLTAEASGLHTNATMDATSAGVAKR